MNVSTLQLAWCLGVFVSIVGGCGDDLAVTDSGNEADGAAEADAASRDAASEDAGSRDASTVDAGAQDASMETRDGGASDASMDAATPDAGLDATTPDASNDAATTDASVDAGLDAATLDASMDAGRDAASMDAGPVDASSTDATAADAAMRDAARPPCGSGALPSLAATDIVAGHTFSSPVFVTSAPDDASVLYVVEQRGTIRVVSGGAVRATPFITLAGLAPAFEQGLLGLAFHPDYATNGRFFLYFTPDSPARNVLAEFRRSAGDPLVADPVEVRRLVELPDAEDNHNAGMIAFGPDGYLYVGIGDGGGIGDMHGTRGNGQNTMTLFGSLLRLDVDATAEDYAAAGNPFSGADGLPQIWHYGLRNPWRFTFDRLTEDLYLTDVGQDQWEELNVFEAGEPGGANLGWRAYEADSVYDPTLAPLAMRPPTMSYAHAGGGVLPSGCAIVGGFVYRGTAIPALQGVYLYGDFCNLNVAALRYCDGALTDHQLVPGLFAGSDFFGNGLSSFGEDANGELYLVFSTSGHVRRIVPAM